MSLVYRWHGTGGRSDSSPETAHPNDVEQVSDPELHTSRPKREIRRPGRFEDFYIDWQVLRTAGTHQRRDSDVM